MGKIDRGILGGFSGQVGPVIGYVWRGRMCMRSMPRQVANPRTEAQVAHRTAFRQMVQLAASMRGAVRVGLREAALDEGLTEYNLFVKLNFGALTAEGVDYKRLRVSCGEVAPVGITAVERDDAGVVVVRFEKNPLRMPTSNDDEVLLYAYCPAMGEGVLSAAAYRRQKQVALVLPDEWDGAEVHLYCFARNYKHECSPTVYVAMEEEGEGAQVETAASDAGVQSMPAYASAAQRGAGAEERVGGQPIEGRQAASGGGDFG